MRQASRNRAAALVAVVVAAFGSSVGVAEGKKKGKKQLGPVVTKTATSTGSGLGTILTATATCTKKQRVVGGGFVIDPSPSSAVPTFTYESQKAGQRSWRTTAIVNDQSPPAETATLTTEAYCRKNAPKTSTVTSTVPTPGGPSTTLGPATDAVCTGKKVKLMSGGFLASQTVQAGDQVNLILDSLSAAIGTWRARVASLELPGSLSGYAYCAKGKAPSTATASASQGNAGSGTVVTATATCPPKKTPVGGGFSQTSLNSTVVLVIYRAQRVGSTWVVSAARSQGLADTLALTSSALCA